MAKASWLSLNPNTGSGNGTIVNTATVHTGRVARSCTVTVTGAGAAKAATYKVNQSPKAEYASFNNGVEMAAAKAGGILTIAGKSNSASLTFSWVGLVPDVQLPIQYNASGIATNNGTAIEGDPGKDSEYEFSVELNIPENTTIEEITRTLKVTAKGGQEAQIAIVQAAGDAYISVTPNEITLDESGSAQSVTVNSNTSWTAS